VKLFRRLSASFFGWQEWRGGSPAEMFSVACREASLIAARRTLRQYAVGWCKGASTFCRPRPHHKAIMYFKDGRHFWFHLRDREARAIFPEIFDA
jgi:hypothetical protein